MEVRNTIRRVEYQQTLELPTKQRGQASENRKRAEARLDSYVQRGNFLQTPTDWSGIMERFARLSEAHTARLGCRTFDTLHVAFALDARCETFVTGDTKQAALATASGLKVRLVEIDD